MNKATLLKIACILFAFCAATAIASPAQRLTTLHSFTGYPFDGAGLDSAVTRGSDGDFYGTTGAGGDNCSPTGCGTVFKVTPGGTETTLYSFCSQPNCVDGADPYGALVQAPDGNFYGTTAGTVFKITPSGTLTTLYSFCSQPNCADGRSPNGIVLATDGNFYGTTNSGGFANCTDGCGTIFKITPSGTLSTLYSFCTQTGCPDGEFPNGELFQASDGNFYGTAPEGGIPSCFPNGCGTVFKITPTGTLTILHSFCTQPNCADGRYPTAPPVQGIDGNLYGTTYTGGANYNGTIYKITPNGALTTLYSFCPANGCADGSLPAAALVPAPGGNFYGTTEEGGTSNYGTVFHFTVLRECTVCPNP